MYVTRMKNDETFVIRSWFQYTYGNSATADTSRLGGLQVSGASGYILNSYYSYNENGNGTLYNMTGGSDMEWWYLNTDEPVRMGETYYHYGTANQLVREDNEWLDKTFVWTYDDAGNIRTCEEYPYTSPEDAVSGTPAKTNTYTYGDSAWGDLLTAYNGVQWSYDQIGNLTNDGTWTYTWQNGRELASMSNGSTAWNYTYDANGMRTSRSNGSTTYTYVYNGDQLVQMTKGSDTLYFTYGAIGPTTVTWNGTTYYYAVNAQGDVMGIFDGSGNCVVTYNWDNAWGYNPEPEGSMADTLGTLNPLRYRSYVYDEETELYYLQSRYYDPEICRFICADKYPATGQDLTGNNMFAYCGNNPVIRVDNSGAFWNIIGGAIVGAVIGAASQAICNLIENKPITDGLGKAALTGAVGGALTAAFPAASTLISVGMSATESVITDIQNGENLPTIVANATLSAGFAAMTSGGTVFSDKQIVSKTVKAVGKILPGNHPSVKKAAKSFLKKTGKAVLGEIGSGIADGVFVYYVSKGTKWVSGMYTGAKDTYKSFNKRSVLIN